MKTGDVAVLLAGTGHHCLSTDGDLLVIGAFLPAGTDDLPAGTDDECTIAEDRPRALKTILKVALLRKDPAYHTGEPLPKP